MEETSAVDKCHWTDDSKTNMLINLLKVMLILCVSAFSS